MKINIDLFCVSSKRSIRDTVSRMDKNRCGVMLIVDSQKRLKGILSDGDVRRAILAKIDFHNPVSQLLKRKEGSKHENPITALVGEKMQVYRDIFSEHNLSYLPLLNAQKKVVGLMSAGDLSSDEPLSARAVVMAGGFGSRLRPLTSDTPKPMLPVGNQPILERIISQLQQAGIRSVNVTTHFKSEMISNHFGDGKDFGVDIHYVQEDQPLGTAGSLALLEKSKEPLLVINGDIVTQVDFRRMLEFHKEQDADLTLAVRQYDFCVPYGVVETTGVVVKRVEEKPVLQNFINAGIYLLNPDVQAEIADKKHQDMPDLINQLIERGKKVVSFPVHEYWLDVGRLEDYEKALSDFKSQRLEVSS